MTRTNLSPKDMAALNRLGTIRPLHIRPLHPPHRQWSDCVLCQFDFDMLMDSLPIADCKRIATAARRASKFLTAMVADRRKGITRLPREFYEAPDSRQGNLFDTASGNAL